MDHIVAPIRNIKSPPHVSSPSRSHCIANETSQKLIQEEPSRGKSLLYAESIFLTQSLVTFYLLWCSARSSLIPDQETQPPIKGHEKWFMVTALYAIMTNTLVTSLSQVGANGFKWAIEHISKRRPQPHHALNKQVIRKVLTNFCSAFVVANITAPVMCVVRTTREISQIDTKCLPLQCLSPNTFKNEIMWFGQVAAANVFLITNFVIDQSLDKIGCYTTLSHRIFQLRGIDPDHPESKNKVDVLEFLVRAMFGSMIGALAGFLCHPFDRIRSVAGTDHLEWTEVLDEFNFQGVLGASLSAAFVGLTYGMGAHFLKRTFSIKESPTTPANSGQDLPPEQSITDGANLEQLPAHLEFASPKNPLWV